MEFYATCPFGLEQALAHELRQLQARSVRPLQGQVSFLGELEEAYRICLLSRLASRVVVVLGRIAAADADELYEGIRSIAWENELGSTASCAFDVRGKNKQLRDPRFVAQRAKDGLVERMLDTTGARPPIEPASPELPLVLRLHGERASVGIALSGSEPLFMRGWEHRTTQAGLRPDYAATLLALTDWQQQSSQRLVVFGSASSLVSEAVAMACAFPAAQLRSRWGFRAWKRHDAQLWEKVCKEADELHATHHANQAEIVVVGSTSTTEEAARMLRAAGLHAQLSTCPAHKLPHLLSDGKASIVVADLTHQDPRPHVQSAYLQQLADAARADAAYQLALCCKKPAPSLELQRDPELELPLILGRDEALFARYDLHNLPQAHQIKLPSGDMLSVAVPSSNQFAARFAKQCKLRSKWARHEDVSTYRIYDADLPDYALAIDLYQGATGSRDEGKRYVCLAEYAPPKQIGKALAAARLRDACRIVEQILELAPEQIFVRERRRERGGSQYAQQSRPPAVPAIHIIEEGGLNFEVDLSSRLDTGIFLDHRLTRGMLRELAKPYGSKGRFLNLFAYTCTASCYAADGGIGSTTSVDLSATYLSWAQRNMQLNGFTGPAHQFIQADVLAWVDEKRHSSGRFDLIFCDPPSFSNSARMRAKSFDVQRDHAELLIGVSRLLSPEGQCVFSCNLKNFKLDSATLAKAHVEICDITEQTIPEDFARNKHVHHCFLLRRGRQK